VSYRIFLYMRREPRTNVARLSIGNREIQIMSVPLNPFRSEWRNLWNQVISACIIKNSCESKANEFWLTHKFSSIRNLYTGVSLLHRATQSRIIKWDKKLKVAWIWFKEEMIKRKCCVTCKTEFILKIDCDTYKRTKEISGGVKTLR